MINRLKMTVQFDVTEAQALALQSMFNFWNQLASQGSSRYVAFYVDGDGNFKPNITCSTDVPIEPLTPEIEDLAHVGQFSHGEWKFDFDPIASHLRTTRDPLVRAFLDHLEHIKTSKKLCSKCNKNPVAGIYDSLCDDCIPF
jgi:hypothetical protein